MPVQQKAAVTRARLCRSAIDGLQSTLRAPSTPDRPACQWTEPPWPSGGEARRHAAALPSPCLVGWPGHLERGPLRAQNAGVSLRSARRSACEFEPRLGPERG